MKNKILSILLSVAIAIGLWVYVITVVDPEYTRTYKVPVDPAQFQYYSVMEERNLLVMEHDEYVTVKLKGNRSLLASIRDEDLFIQASLGNVTKAGEYQLEYTVNVPGAILVEEQNSEKINIRVDDEVTKELEIKADIVGEVPTDFAPDTTDIFPDMETNTVTVIGPNSVVKNIAFAKLDGTINLAGKTEDVIGEYELVLCNSAGKPVDAKGVAILGTKKVAVRIPIEMYKDLKLDLNITEGGGLKKTDVMLNYETLRVSGPKAQIEALGDTLILGDLDLTTLRVDETTLTYKIELKDDRIVNRSGIEEVKVTVNIGDLQEKEMVIPENKFVIIHPEGMTADVDAAQLKVTLRGTAAQLAIISEADLTVRLDYSDAAAGAGVKCIPEVVMNSALFRDVVVVKASEISATVK